MNWPIITRGRNGTTLNIVWCFLASLAHADGVPRIAPINVFGHYETAVGTSDAASAGYITPQLIDDRPLLRPGEVLEYVPGMIVTQHSGAGKANQYFLRGFNLDHGTDFATDLAGMPVNLRTHAHGQGYMDLNFMIPELVSRIDYYKGPYFAQQGDFATAGSASIHYAESLPNSLAELGIGTDRYARAMLAGSPEVGAGRMVYGMELYHDNGPWGHPDNYRKLNGVLRYTQRTGDGQWGVTAMGYSGKWNSTDQIPQRAIDSGLIDRLGAIDPSDGGRTYRYSLSGDYRKQLAGGQLQSTAYGIRYSLKLYSNFTHFLNDPVNGDQFNQYDNRKILGWNGSWTRPDKVFGLDMTSTLGWDFRQDRLDPVAISGVRADRYDFKVDSNIADNSGNRSAGIGSPRLSMIFGPWQKTEYFVNVGEGFHSNDGRGTTTHVDPGTGEAVDPVTPLVRAKGAELGVRTEVIPNLQSSLSLWYLHLDSELVFEGDTGTDTPGRPSRRAGVEWSNHYTPTAWLLVDLDLAYTRARFADNAPVGNHIPEALQATAEAGFTVRMLGPWTASLFGRYFGPRSLLEDNSVKSKSTTLFNAQTTYEVNKQLRLRFDVFNIFDRKADDITYYYRSRLPGEPADGVNDIHFHPVERRSLRVATLFKF